MSTPNAESASIYNPPAASVEFLPLDEAAEAQRAARVEQDVGPVSPGVVHYTAEILFPA